MSSETIVSASKPIALVGGSVIASGEINDICQYVEGFIAVDSGADALLDVGITPLAVIGDLDSLSDKARDTFAGILCEVREQSTTDFEKALSRVAAPAVICTGFTGGRMDHILSVLSVMIQYSDMSVVLVDQHDVSFLVPAGRTSLALSKGTRVSAMPVLAATMTLAGVVWPFANQPVSMAGFTSPSNAALGGDVIIDTDAPVLITLPRACLATVLKSVVRAQ